MPAALRVGDTIIKKEFRYDVPKSAPEVFFRTVKFWKHGEKAPAVFCEDGVNYLHIKVRPPPSSLAPHSSLPPPSLLPPSSLLPPPSFLLPPPSSILNLINLCGHPRPWLLLFSPALASPPWRFSAYGMTSEV